MVAPWTIPDPILDPPTYHIINENLHIRFSFSLVDDIATEGSPRMFSDAEARQLMRLYPSTTGIASWDNFLELQSPLCPRNRGH
jgi:hypothetical protein